MENGKWKMENGEWKMENEENPLFQRVPLVAKETIFPLSLII
jgi:hypothetical protein